MKKLLILLIVFPIAALVGLAASAVVWTQAGENASLGAFLAATDPTGIVALLAASLAVTAFVVGLISSDYSWVDRLWSTAPVAYAWIYAAKSGFATTVTIAALLITAWGARLTFNFARRGGYTSIEDYRWQILHKRMPNELVWQLFHFGFIAVYQNLLFVLFTSPLSLLLHSAGSGVNPGFIAAGVALLVLLAIETVADGQQWHFQNAKQSATPDAELAGDIERGFLTHGLFRYSRHPNYFAEVSIWWCVYLMAVAISGRLFDWTAIGAILLTVLFVGSTRFTESISASKYPAYAAYAKNTSAVIPMPPRGARRDDATAETR